MSFNHSFNEHFIIFFVVAIVVSLFRWTMSRPAKKLDGDGIILKFSPVIYGVLIFPMLMIVAVLALALWYEGLSEEAVLPLGLGTVMLLGLGWFLRFLMGRKVMATDQGVLQQKGKRQKYLKWVDVKSVKLDRYWIKLVGESEEVVVAMNLTGLRDFLTLMREKLPQEMCEEVVNKAGKQFSGTKTGW